jgi:dihydroorotate dehydrogenase electron transfer subunit
LRPSLFYAMIKHALQETVRIVSHARIRRGYFRIALESGNIASSAQPGQFVMVDVKEAGMPLLRRPLGIHSVNKKKIEFLYEAVGAGTQNLSRKKPGEKLGIIGPLGNGFDLALSGSCLNPVLVAGGMGVAPLFFLAQRLAGKKRLATGGIRVLLGARSRDGILCAQEFRKTGCDVTIATDDGSRGFRGKVTDLLERMLSSVERQSVIYACGPEPMIKRIAFLSQRYRVPAQVSLEAHMSCGFGACLGCVVDTAQGYKRVCKDGPVFMAQEVIF